MLCHNMLEFQYDVIIVIFCQVFQKLIVGDDFLTRIFIFLRRNLILSLVFSSL
jgi:hypothetical protein